MIFRSVSFLVLAVLALSAPLALFTVGVLVYALRWFGLEMVILAFAIDLTFGAHHWPLYTLTTVLVVAIVEWWKPTLSVY